MTGEELRKTRKLWGMTQSEFADALGIPDHSRVSDMENGKRRIRPTLEMLIRIVERNLFQDGGKSNE